MVKDVYDVAFITINYNGFHDTRELINSIQAAKFSFSYTIIVIDNGSKENEWLKLYAEFPFIEGVYSHTNLGFAGGNNLGISLVQSRYLYFINNDTVFPKDANSQVAGMITFLEKNSSVAGLSPKLKFPLPTELLQFAGFTPLSNITLRNKQIGYMEEDLGQYDTLLKTPYLHGAAMFLRSDVVAEVGEMYTGYFLYYEELDWCCRLTKNYDLYYYPEAILYHKESASTGVASPLKVYYLTRNRIHFAYRNRQGIIWVLACMYLLIAGVIHMIHFFLQGANRQGRAVFEGLRDAFKMFKAAV